MRSWIPTLGSLEVICRRRRIQENQENQENQEMRMGRKKEVENLKRKRERK